MQQFLSDLTKTISASRSFAFTYLSIITCVLFCSSCGQHDSDYIINHNQPSEVEILTHLEAHGYDISLINIEGDFIVYEDIVIAMEAVVEDMTNPTVEEVDEDLPYGVDTRQRGVSITHALTKTNTRSGLNIYIAPSILRDCGPNVLQSVYDAVDEYRQIENISLNMQIVESRNEANITIASDLDSDIYPEASPFYDVAPYSMLANVAFMGIAGPYIAVDPKWENINYNTIKSAMMHELGHSIGLHHTGTSSGDQIHSTPDEQESSIMCPVARNTGKFSNWDKKAIRMYYAEELTQPTKVTVTQKNKTTTINYTNPKKNWQPYYWVRVYKYNADGSYNTFKDFKSDISASQGKGTITWKNQDQGDYTYRLKGMRYKKDVKSRFSSPASLANDKQMIASTL